MYIHSAHIDIQTAPLYCICMYYVQQWWVDIKNKRETEIIVIVCQWPSGVSDLQRHSKPLGNQGTEITFSHSQSALTCVYIHPHPFLLSAMSCKVIHGNLHTLSLLELSHGVCQQIKVKGIRVVKVIVITGSQFLLFWGQNLRKNKRILRVSPNQWWSFLSNRQERECILHRFIAKTVTESEISLQYITDISFVRNTWTKVNAQEEFKLKDLNLG